MPSLANGDASTSVIFPNSGVSLAASLMHSAPDFVFAGMYFPMFSICSCSVLSLETATRKRMASAEIVGKHRRCLSAIAKTQPQNQTIPIIGPPHDGQSTKTLSSDINESGHGYLST